MNGYQIFEKYWDSLVITATNPHLLAHDAVRLALRLAIHEAAGAHDDTALVAAQNEAAMLRQRLATAQEEAENSRNTLAQAQIDELNEWLRQYNEPLYVTGVSTSQTVLEIVVSLEQEVSELRAKLDQAEQSWSAAQADTDHYELQAMRAPAEIQTNGNGPVDPTPAAQSAPDWGRSHPAWDGLGRDAGIAVYELAHGEKSWRRIPKPLRLELARRVISCLEESPTQSAFNRHRPQWMPQATSLAQSFGVTWNDLTGQSAPGTATSSGASQSQAAS